MTTHAKHCLALGACVLAALATAERSFACNHAPSAYVSDWYKHEPLGDMVSFDGSGSYDPDAGDYISYSWSFPAEAYSISGQTSSTSSCRFNTAGSYYVNLWVTDNHSASDYDYAYVYIVEVASVTESSTGATSIWVPVNGSASLQATPNPSTTWPSGKPTWSITTQPTGASASVTPGSSGAATLNNMSVPGLYRAKAACGSGDDGASIDVTAIDVRIDTRFPAYVAAGANLALSCTRQGDTSGTLTWSPYSGPSTPSFSDVHAVAPNFSASVPGTYVVQLQYTKGGATVTKTSGTITVNPVSVDITPPAGSVVESYHTLQLDCMPHGGTGSNYAWTKISGPGNVTFFNPTDKNPTFQTNTTGNYSIGLQCTINGITVTAPAATIAVVDVDVTVPISSPVSVARGSALALDCAGLNGTASGYAWTPADLITPSNARNPSFTSNTAGTYTAAVQCTVAGISVSNAGPTIHVVEVASVAENTTGQDPIYIAAGPSAVAYLQAQPYPSAAWPSGKPTWSVLTQPPGSTASVVPGGNGAAAMINLTTPGLYQAKAVCGATDDGDTVDVTAFQVGITARVGAADPVVLPVQVGVGAPLTLNCNPSPDVGGTCTWTVTPLQGWTLLDSTALTRTLRIDQPGTYEVRVDYTKQYGPSTPTATAIGTITANIVGVQISLPPNLHGYVAPYSPLQLDCSPSGILGGTYRWLPSPGNFSNYTARNPTFRADVPGVYSVRVEYEAGGVTVVSDPATIGVVAVTVDPPANGALTIKAGESLTLNCSPQYGPGTDYSWTVPTPATVTPANQQTTVFSSTEPGYYAAAIQCNVGGVPVGDATGPISVIGVGQLYASCASDYNDTVLYVSPGTMVTLGAYPSPDINASWPADTPTWSLQGPGGTLAPTHGTYGSSAFLGGLTEPGTYTITAHCGTSNKSIEVIVVALDLDISGVDESEEQSPGGYVVVNGDDDDSSGVSDNSEQGPVPNEDDLVAITLSVTPVLNTGVARLEATAGSSNIRIWTDSTKGTEVPLPKTWVLSSEAVPATLYVEGVAGSTSERDVILRLSWASQPGAEPTEAQIVSLTVSDVILRLGDGEEYRYVPPNVPEQVSVIALCSQNYGIVTLSAASGWNPDLVQVRLDSETEPLDLSSPHQWDLSNPLDPTPASLNVQFPGQQPTVGDLNLCLTWGRTGARPVISDVLRLTRVQMKLDPATLELFPGISNPIHIIIQPTSLNEGRIILRVANGTDHINLWADEARTTPIPLSGVPPEASWNLSEGSLPSVVYAEGGAGEPDPNGVMLDLLYDRSTP